MNIKELTHQQKQELLNQFTASELQSELYRRDGSPESDEEHANGGGDAPF